MPSTRVGRRGQLTIHKAVRRSLGLSEGDRVAFVEHGGDIVLRPVRHSLQDLRGSVPVDGPQDFDAIREATHDARADRLTTPAPSANVDHSDPTDAH